MKVGGQLQGLSTVPHLIG